MVSISWPRRVLFWLGRRERAHVSVDGLGIFVLFSVPAVLIWSGPVIFALVTKTALVSDRISLPELISDDARQKNQRSP